MVQTTLLKNNCNDDDNDEGGFMPVSSIGNLEAVAHEAALADGLISDQSGKQESQKLKKAGLRRGKWTTEEEFYANRLIYEFKLGLLPLTDGTTLRTFLSKLLNCDPMRISKKFVGQNCIGKQVFRRRQQDLEKLSPEQIEISRKELAELERKFLERVAQTNRMKSSGGAIGKGPKDRTDYEDENGNAVVAPWMIPPDDAAGHFQDSKADSIALKLGGTGGLATRLGSGNPKAIVSGLRSSAAQSNRTSSDDSASAGERPSLPMSKPPEYSNYGDVPNYPYINPYQYPLNQYYGGGQSTILKDSLSADTSSATETSRNMSGVGDGPAGSISKVSSLDLLCNIDNHRFPGQPSEVTGAFPASSFGSLSNFASLYRSNYFPWMNFNNTAGIANTMATSGELLLSGEMDSNGLQTKGAASTSLGNFPTLMEWPSMNNLVVAAETMKSVDDLESLGISTASLAFLAASSDNVGAFRSESMQAAAHGGGGGGGEERSNTAALNAVADGHLSDGSADKVKQQQQHHQHQLIDDVGYPLEDGSSLAIASALALAAHKSSKNTGVNCSSLIVDATSHIYNQGQQISDLVMHPQPPLGQQHSADGSTIDSQSSAGLSPRGMISIDPSNVWGEGPSTSSVIASAFSKYHNAMKSGGAAGLRRGQSPTASSHDDRAASPTSDMPFYNRSVSVVETQPLNDGGSTNTTNIGLGLDDSEIKMPGSNGELPRNSSVENFWLLVDMGDLPKPDKDVLSEEFMSTRRNDMMLAMHHHEQQQQQQQQQQLGLCIDTSNDVKGNPYYLQQPSQPVVGSPRAGGSMLTQNLLQNSVPSSAKSGSSSSRSARGGKKEGASPRLYNSSSSSSSSQPTSSLQSAPPQMIMPSSAYQHPTALIANQSGQVRGRAEPDDQNNVYKRSKTVEIKMEPSSEKSLQHHHHPQQHQQQLQHYPQAAQIPVGTIQADIKPSLKIEWNQG